MAINKDFLAFANVQNFTESAQIEKKLTGACSTFGLSEKDFSFEIVEIANPKPKSLCFKFTFKAPITSDLLTNLKLELAKEKLDFFVLEKNRLALKLALFDMDSTLIQAEVMDELARAYGVYEKVSQITNTAMQGKIDFNESFTKRLAMLKDMPTGTLEQIRSAIEFTPNAQILFEHLHKNSVHTVLVSGGFDYFANYFAEKLGIKEFHANVLQAKNNKLTGEAVLPILDSDFKSRLLQQKQADLGLSASQVLAVGDGANDIPMLLKAGIGVAYKAKPLVQEKSNLNLRFNDLDSLAYLLYLD